MMRKTVFTLVLCLALSPVLPDEGFGRPHHYRHPVHYRHHYVHGDALAWGVAGLVVGTMLTATVARPSVYVQPPPSVVYVQPSPRIVAYPPVASGTGQIFNYPPEVPPGMCRWERPMLDEYGRPVLTRSGIPAKVYTLGSCYYPPQY